MCGRVTWRWDAQMQAWVRQWVGPEQAQRLAQEDWIKRDRYNVAPTERLPVATPGRMEPMVWGCEGTINARLETAWDVPLWRSRMGRGHAILPVTGFYEWKKGPSKPVPHWFHARDGPLLLAALAMDGWISIVTTAAQGPVAEVHDRMPLCLDDEAVDAWLGAQARADTEQLADHTVPLVGHQVDVAANNASSEGPHLIEPVRRWF